MNTRGYHYPESAVSAMGYVVQYLKDNTFGVERTVMCNEFKLIEAGKYADMEVAIKEASASLLENEHFDEVADEIEKLRQEVDNEIQDNIQQTFVRRSTRVLHAPERLSMGMKANRVFIQTKVPNKYADIEHTLDKDEWCVGHGD